MKIILGTSLLLAIVTVPSLHAQSIRGGGNPYSSQLVTDPDAGNVQGIQRYGRPLATDPAQGTTYPYYVFPTVVDQNGPNPFAGRPMPTLAPMQAQLLRQKQEDVSRSLKKFSSADDPLSRKQASQNDAEGSDKSRLQAEKAIQSYSLLDARVFSPAPGEATKVFVQNQPLIQIKLRVIEILRDNSLGAASSLDFIRSKTGDFSYVALPKLVPSGDDQLKDSKGNNVITPAVANVNSSTKNLTGSSRFDVNGLLGVTSASTGLSGLNAGAGALVNLTGEHLNFIASILATELEADLLTAPVIVTTNGEAAEFVAGTKQPFNLGTVNTNTPANEGENNTGRIQNSLFYKHIGTYLHVTPRIVNYGGQGERAGDGALTMNEVPDWNYLIAFLVRENLVPDQPTEPPPELKWQTYTRPGRLVPLNIKIAILDYLNEYSKSELVTYFDNHTVAEERGLLPFPQSQKCGVDGCQWTPDDCTIDIEIVARFSNALKPEAEMPLESDVRSIKNILQIKNGHGLVMAGLLGESDVEALAKVPIAGDLPLVGWLFRSKSVSRKKSEILIFLEAEVMPADPHALRSASMSDLELARPYVAGSTLNNPLEIGLHRSGIGNYLPPLAHEEQSYWHRCGARINRIRTTSYDMFR